eukprot:549580-Rhodomonas_salina.3
MQCPILTLLLPLLAGAIKVAQALQSSRKNPLAAYAITATCLCAWYGVPGTDLWHGATRRLRNLYLSDNGAPFDEPKQIRAIMIEW